MSNDF